MFVYHLIIILKKIALKHFKSPLNKEKQFPELVVETGFRKLSSQDWVLEVALRKPGSFISKSRFTNYKALIHSVALTGLTITNRELCGTFIG